MPWDKFKSLATSAELSVVAALALRNRAPGGMDAVSTPSNESDVLFAAGFPGNAGIITTL